MPLSAATYTYLSSPFPSFLSQKEIIVQRGSVLNDDWGSILFYDLQREKFRSQDDSVRNSWGGRRRFSLSIEEEREFLSTWEVEATAGGVLYVPPIHAALVKRLGHNTPMSTTYRMLARHGWRKVQPDTKHPKSDQSAQEEFKKTPGACGCRLRKKSEQPPGSPYVSG